MRRGRAGAAVRCGRRSAPDPASASADRRRRRRAPAPRSRGGPYLYGLRARAPMFGEATELGRARAKLVPSAIRTHAHREGRVHRPEARARGATSGAEHPPSKRLHPPIRLSPGALRPPIGLSPRSGLRPPIERHLSALCPRNGHSPSERCVRRSDVISARCVHRTDTRLPSAVPAAGTRSRAERRVRRPTPTSARSRA